MAAPAISRSQLEAGLRALGLREGSVVLVHARMSALGWVVGGSGAVVSALLEALGPDGTLMAYASWQEHVYHASEWPEEHRAAYVAEPPVFDPATAEAARDHGRIPERVRTWPGAERSVHPEASMVAVGRLARTLTAHHPQQDAYGPDSPLGRLVAAGGDVLMLGAPLETLTILHHAEAIASPPGKRTVTFEIPVRTADGDDVRRTRTSTPAAARTATRTSTCPSRTSSRRSGPPRSRPASARRARSAPRGATSSPPPSWSASASPGSTNASLSRA